MTIAATEPDPFAAIAPAASYGILVLARVVPLVAFTPLFGGEAASRRMRAGLAILIALPIAATADLSAVAGLDRVTIGVLALKEILVGATIALMVSAVFEVMASTGSLLDLARGQSMASVLDPQFHQPFSPLSVFLRQLTLVLFLVGGGYGVVCRALMDSLVALPPDRLAPALARHDFMVQAILSLIPQLFLIAVKLALPAFAVSLVVDVAFGLLGRAAPNIQSYFLAMPLRTILGLLALLLSLQMLLHAGRAHMNATLESISTGLRSPIFAHDGTASP